MKFQLRLSALTALLAVLPGCAAAATIDGASLEYGGGTRVHMLRAGVQSNWESRRFQSSGTHLGGYWDASIAQWRGDAHLNVPGNHQDITSIGLTPVLRLQSDTMRGWYAEGGIGLHLLSRLYNNNGRQLSTALQFGDHLGAGYVFDNGWEAGLKIIHFSNGGVKEPNSGINFTILKVSRRF